MTGVVDVKEIFTALKGNYSTDQVRLSVCFSLSLLCFASNRWTAVAKTTKAGGARRKYLSGLGAPAMFSPVLKTMHVLDMRQKLIVLRFHILPSRGMCIAM